MKIRLIRLIGLIGPIGLICFMFYVLCSMFPGEVRAEELRYLHTDHLGSAVAVSDERGEKVEEGRYLPFGSRVYNNYNNHKRGFTGQERDGEVSLYNYNARLYNPRLSQFVSADKAGTDKAGTSPATTNRFAYVRNNPLRFIDPSGNMDTAFDDGGGGFGDFSKKPTLAEWIKNWQKRFQNWQKRLKQQEKEYFANCGTPAQCYFGMSEEQLEEATWLGVGMSEGISPKVFKQPGLWQRLFEKNPSPRIGTRGSPLSISGREVIEMYNRSSALQYAAEALRSGDSKKMEEAIEKIIAGMKQKYGLEVIVTAPAAVQEYTGQPLNYAALRGNTIYIEQMIDPANFLHQLMHEYGAFLVRQRYGSLYVQFTGGQWVTKWLDNLLEGSGEAWAILARE